MNCHVQLIKSLLDYIHTMISRTDQIDVSRLSSLYDETERQARARLTAEHVTAANSQDSAPRRYAQQGYQDRDKYGSCTSKCSRKSSGLVDSKPRFIASCVSVDLTMEVEE